MTVLNINTTTNFAGNPLNNVTKLQFGNTSGTATASFGAAQFDNVQIADALLIAGSASVNAVVVNNAINFDASGWTFANWSASDTITLIGTQIADFIIGSSQADTINGGGGADVLRGGLGADILNGGAGDDTFAYGQAAEIVAGEIIRGGTSTGDSGSNDRINISGGTGIYDFTAAQISGIETLDFTAANFALRTARVAQSQIGAGAIANVVGGAGKDTLEIVMNGNNISLADLNITGFTQTENLRSPADEIRITGGTSGQDSIVGSSFDDVVRYSGGSDFVFLGSGSDRLQFQAGTAIGAVTFAGSSLVEPDSGIDTVEIINTGSYDLRAATFLGVERLGFLAGSSNLTRNVILNGVQVGEGKINIFEDAGNTTTNVSTLTVNGSNVDLGTASANGIDAITINGTSGNDTLTTISSVDSTINAGEGDDIITGGAFAGIVGGVTAVADKLFGGGGNDTFVYAQTGSLISSGEIIDGGAGTADRILFGSSTGDFTGAAISGIEKFEFAGNSAHVATLTASQALAIGTFSGSAGGDVVQIGDSGTVNLSALNVTNFANGSIVGNAYRQVDFIEFTGGASGIDTFTGTSREDRMRTSGGADTFLTGDGDDLVIVGELAHLVSGLTVNMGAGSNDTIRFNGPGTINLGSNLTGFENIDFGNGTYTFNADGARFGAGKIVHLTSAGDVAVTLTGDVNLSALTFGAWDSDNSITLNGTDANNTLTGSLAAETINGGLGNDIITGGRNADHLKGDAGDDRFVLNDYVELGQITLQTNGNSVDDFDGGAGSDDRIVSTIAGSAPLGGTDLRFSIIDGVEGFEFAGSSAEQQTLLISEADLGFGQINSIFGNTGADEVSVQLDNAFNNFSSLVLTNWTDGADRFRMALAEGDTRGHNVTGTSGSDAITLQNASSHTVSGGAGSDIISTGSGADFIDGGAGADVISGGKGIDSLFGGANGDIFVLSPDTADRDFIFDFASGVDRLGVRPFDFGLFDGTLAAGQVVTNTTGLAGDADDRFIFNQTTGELFLDFDGTGIEARRLIATLSGVQNLSVTDFSLIS